MRTLTTSIDIAAPRAKVWRALTDLDGYGAWNPFIVEAVGQTGPGAMLAIRMRIPGKGVQAYRVRVTRLVEEQSFGWLGHFHVPGLIDGDHMFELADLPDGGVRVSHNESFRGLLVPFVWRGFLQAHLLPCFERLNRNLKAHCEGRPLPEGLA